MKELKISISDELYEGLSDVEDMDSFVATLLEKALRRAEYEASISTNISNYAGVEDILSIMPTQEDVAGQATSSTDALNGPSGNGMFVSIEKIVCFQLSIADLVNRIGELEDLEIRIDGLENKIRDMNHPSLSLKGISSINEAESIENFDRINSISDSIESPSDSVVFPSLPDSFDSPLESDSVISPSFPDLTDLPLESDPVISPS
ncbi:hypothetical protein HNV12_26330, partial [Methanococcoides sp. SA1]|nr:hypothetical protein [Methanococcoides sp. SA1]